MSFVITRAPRDPEAPITPPVTSDGDAWTFGMWLPGFVRLAWADDASGLVAALLGDPDYLARSEQEQMVARIRRALRLQVVTQARINASAMLTGEWDDLCEWERHVLNGPRHVAPNQPDGFPTRHLFNGLDVWTASTPLVCVTTACEPLNPGVPPVVGTSSGVWVIDPIDDEGLLDSLEDLCLIRTFTRSS